jgi:hypothetical protein
MEISLGNVIYIKIEAQNNADGKGALFSFIIPK